MKILHIISTLSPEAGGPSLAVKNFLSVYPDMGVSGEVLTLDAPGSSWSKLVDVPVYELGLGFSSFAYSARLIPWLRERAKLYDAVIVHGLWQYLGLATWVALRNTKTPYFVFTHGMLDPWFKRSYPLKHAKKWLYWPWGQYPVLRDAKAVFFTSEEERRASRESFWLYKCHEVVLGYGTRKPNGDAEIQKSLFLTTYPQLVGKQFLLFLGRIHPKKGCDILIEAYANRIKENSFPWFLIFAGPDQVKWKVELQALSEKLGVGDRIIWVGMLSGDIKWGAFYASDAFVLPSHQENFGIAVAEALACSKPVLISNKVNIWHEIHDDMAGIVADDTLAGVKSMLKIWEGKSCDDRKQMSVNALTCFMNRFEMREVVANLVKHISVN